MGNTYRQSRCIEASLIDFIQSKLTDSWSGINVTKTFSRVYEIGIPAICVRCGVTEHEKVEIGSDSTKRNPQVLIDIFANSDGLRLDLKDFLISELKGGCPYYLYEIENGAVKTKTLNGRIRVLRIDDDPINFDTEKNTLDNIDKYRHLITLSISLGKVEE